MKDLHNENAQSFKRAHYKIEQFAMIGIGKTNIV